MTAKALAIKVIKNQPEDSTMNELIDELLMGASIQRGIEDSLAGRVISHEQLKKEVESWN